MGLAAAGELARRGLETALVERSEIRRPIGSSKGEARIYCPAPVPAAGYLSRFQSALDAWRRAEDDCGVELLRPSGALSVGSTATDGRSALAAAGIESELLDPAEVRRRFELDLGGDRPVLFQPDAGVILASEAHTALYALARAEGVSMHEHERVLTITNVGDAVEVVSDSAEWEVGAVIIAAGGWTPGLLASDGPRLPLRVTCQSIAYFDLRRPLESVPALIDYEGLEPYSLYDPRGWLKASLHTPGPEADPERSCAPRGCDLDAIADWVATVFGERAEPVDQEACNYTSTPDDRFLIQRHGRSVIASACGGQGFQYAPDSGSRAADLAVEALAGGSR